MFAKYGVVSPYTHKDWRVVKRAFCVVVDGSKHKIPTPITGPVALFNPCILGGHTDTLLDLLQYSGLNHGACRQNSWNALHKSLRGSLGFRQLGCSKDLLGFRFVYVPLDQLEKLVNKIRNEGVYYCNQGVVEPIASITMRPKSTLKTWRKMVDGCRRSTDLAHSVSRSCLNIMQIAQAVHHPKHPFMCAFLFCYLYS